MALGPPKPLGRLNPFPLKGKGARVGRRVTASGAPDGAQAAAVGAPGVPKPGVRADVALPSAEEVTLLRRRRAISSKVPVRQRVSARETACLITALPPSRWEAHAVVTLRVTAAAAVIAQTAKT